MRVMRKCYLSAFCISIFIWPYCLAMISPELNSKDYITDLPRELKFHIISQFFPSPQIMLEPLDPDCLPDVGKVGVGFVSPTKEGKQKSMRVVQAFRNLMCTSRSWYSFCNEELVHTYIMDNLFYAQYNPLYTNSSDLVRDACILVEIGGNLRYQADQFMYTIFKQVPSNDPYFLHMKLHIKNMKDPSCWRSLDLQRPTEVSHLYRLYYRKVCLQSKKSCAALNLNTAQARKWLHDDLELHPEKREYLVFLASLYKENKHFKQALKIPQEKKCVVS